MKKHSNKFPRAHSAKKAKSSSNNIERARITILLFLFAVFISLIKLENNELKEKSLKQVGQNQLVQSPEIDDEKLKHGIKNLVDGIFQSDKKLLQGINQVLISREDIGFLSSQNASCTSANILGAYFNGTIIIKDSGDEVNKHTLFHEIGHNVWKKIDGQKKDEWRLLFSQTKNFINLYSKTNAEEDFAENFACYFAHFDYCMNKTDKTKMDFIGTLLSGLKN